MTAIIKQTLKQAKADYKKNGPRTSEKEARQLERGAELDRRAELIKERERNRKAAQKRKREKEEKDREAKRRAGVGVATQLAGFNHTQHQLKGAMEAFLGLGKKRMGNANNGNEAAQAARETIEPSEVVLNSDELWKSSPVQARKDFQENTCAVGDRREPDMPVPEADTEGVLGGKISVPGAVQDAVVLEPCKAPVPDQFKVEAPAEQLKSDELWSSSPPGQPKDGLKDDSKASIYSQADDPLVLGSTRETAATSSPSEAERLASQTPPSPQLDNEHEPEHIDSEPWNHEELDDETILYALHAKTPTTRAIKQASEAPSSYVQVVTSSPSQRISPTDAAAQAAMERGHQDPPRRRREGCESDGQNDLPFAGIDFDCWDDLLVNDTQIQRELSPQTQRKPISSTKPKSKVLRHMENVSFSTQDLTFSTQDLLELDAPGIDTPTKLHAASCPDIQKNVACSLATTAPAKSSAKRHLHQNMRPPSQKHKSTFPQLPLATSNSRISNKAKNPAPPLPRLPLTTSKNANLSKPKNAHNKMPPPPPPPPPQRSKPKSTHSTKPTARPTSHTIPPLPTKKPAPRPALCKGRGVKWTPLPLSAFGLSTQLLADAVEDDILPDP